MRLKEFLQIQDTVEKLKSEKVSFSLAYKLSLIMRDCEKNMEFYRNSLSSLIREYGIKDENGNIVENSEGNLQIDPNKLPILQDKYNELLNCEMVISHFLTKEDLAPLSLSAEEVMNLLPIIQD